MIDIISKDDFISCIKLLEAAFMKKAPKETIGLYHNKLGYTVTADEMISAVDFIIDTDHFFPSIARLKEVLPAPKANQESIEELCS